MGNILDELDTVCVDCNENETIDGFRCFGCDFDYNEAYYENLFEMENN